MKTTRGFTLFEIVISLSIILILALIGVSTFGSARNSMNLNLKTDEIVNQLYKSREKSRTSSFCFGFKFKKGDVPKSITAKYENKTCGTIEETSDFTSTKDFIVSGPDDLTVLYAPPKGELFMRKGDGTTKVENAEISFESPKSPVQSRAILINKNSPSIEKK